MNNDKGTKANGSSAGTNDDLDEDGRKRLPAEDGAASDEKGKDVPASRAGWITKLFGSDSDDGKRKAGEVIAKNKGDVVLVVKDVKHPFPVTAEAMEEAFKGYSLTVVGIDGTAHVLNGMLAAAGGKFLHALEAVRGKARSGKVTADLIRQEFADFYSVGGSDRSGSKAVMTDADLEGFTDIETLKAFLRTAGVVAKAK
jgi:hypothetical protein